jgi:hypothetical protein
MDGQVLLTMVNGKVVYDGTAVVLDGARAPHDGADMPSDAALGMAAVRKKLGLGD